MGWYLCGRNVKCTQYFQFYNVHIKPDVSHANNYLFSVSPDYIWNYILEGLWVYVFLLLFFILENQKTIFLLNLSKRRTYCYFSFLQWTIKIYIMFCQIQYDSS